MRIVIADELPIYQIGLVTALSWESDFAVVGLGNRPVEAVELSARHAPDVVLLGVETPTEWLHSIADIRRRWPRVRIALVTQSQRQEDITAALRLGVAAYVLRSVSTTDLLQTLRMIARGETYLTPSLAWQMLTMSQQADAADDSPESLPQPLTERERLILQELVLARTNKEIARNLNLTEKTVKYYMGRLMQKLRARNRTEAAIRARELTSAV